MIKKIWPSGKPTRSQRITDLRSEFFRLNYTHWSQFSRMLNEVFLDHMDKKGMITSFRNTIDFSLSVRLKGVKITRERGITCSQAFNRVYFTGKKLFVTGNLLVHYAAGAFFSNWNCGKGLGSPCLSIHCSFLKITSFARLFQTVNRLYYSLQINQRMFQQGP